MGFLDTLLGKDASRTANAAAADTYGKQQSAIGDLRAAGIQFASNMTGLAGRLDPYAGAGTDALSRLMSGLGLAGDGADFTAAYRALPGYRAGLDTGLDSVARKMDAIGMPRSGNTLQALYRYGSDYEDQRADDYLSRLMGLVGTGQSAAGQQISTIGQGFQGQLGAEATGFGGAMNAAPTIGQGMVAGANAESSALGNLMNMGAYLAGSGLSGMSGTGMNLLKLPQGGNYARNAAGTGYRTPNGFLAGGV